MTQPTLWDAYGIPHYPLPLKIEDRRHLFDEWMRRNPLLVEQIHDYRLNNNDRALFGRYLLEKYPRMSVASRKSMFDGEGA